MTFQVIDGGIPERIEDWLAHRAVVWVGRVGDEMDGPWVLCTESRQWPFAWPHDRDPALAEAIEAVMAQEG